MMLQMADFPENRGQGFIFRSSLHSIRNYSIRNYSSYFRNRRNWPALYIYNEVMRVRAKARYTRFSNAAFRAKNGRRHQYQPRYRRGVA